MNKIKGNFKLNGESTILQDCDYLNIELVGKHAEQKNASLPIILSCKWILSKSGYVCTYDFDKLNLPPCRGGIKLHRLLKPAPVGYVVDHINHNSLDNRLENLRVCTPKENSYNTSRRNGKFKGVKKQSNGKWNAKIHKDGKKYELKDIGTEKEAAKLYDILAEELFGQYAGKNFN